MDRSGLDVVVFQEGANVRVGSSLNSGWIVGPKWLMDQIVHLPGVSRVGRSLRMGEKHPLNVFFTEDCSPRALLTPEAAAILEGRQFREDCPYMRND